MVTLRVRPWVLVVVAIVAFEAVLAFQTWDGTTLAVVDDSLLACASFVAAEACRRRSRREAHSQRRAWGLLGLGTCVLGFGQVAYAIQAVTWDTSSGGGTTPADLVLALAVPIVALALIRMAGPSLSNRLATALDAATIAASCLLVSWVLVLGPAYRTADGAAEKVTTMFYIGGSLTLTALVLVLAARWRGDGPTLLLLGVAFAWTSISSAAYGLERLDDTYRTGDLLIDAGWFAPLLLVALAASRRATGANDDPQRQALLTLFVPYVALLFAAVTVVTVLIRGEGLDSFLKACIATVVVVVLARQALALLELGGLNRSLETRIEERTVEVRRSEASLRALLRNSSDVIAVIRADGSFTYVSPAADKVLDHQHEGLLGHYVLDLVHPGDRAAVSQVLEAVARGGLPTATVGCRMVRGDGEWLPIEATASPHHEGEGLVLNIRDVRERAAFEEEMRRQSSYDGLTALANRRLFNERVRHALDRATRSGEDIAVMFVDIDHFKRINDTFGHAVGDEVLIQVAERLASCLRPADTAARLGGDEFAVLLEDTGAEQAHEVASRVEQALAPAFTLGDQSITATASIGVTACTAGAGTSDGLLREADVAMYQAKAQGRAQAAVFHADMHSALIEKMELESGLRRAIEEERLHLDYQPLVDLTSSRIVGVEALLRWTGAHDNLVPPSMFIPLAEERGLIQQLDRWVLEEACRQVHLWQQEFPRNQAMRVYVNLSAMELREPLIIEEIGEILERTGLVPRHLVLEITENAVLPDPKAATDLLRRAHELGVGVALDDFGVGTSGLACLRHLQLDVIKIDQSFVAGIEAGPRGHRLALAIVQMAHSLELTTVAEAVETPNQLSWLRRFGCDSGQGYLFSPPLSGHDMGQLLSHGPNLLSPRETPEVTRASAENPAEADVAR